MLNEFEELKKVLPSISSYSINNSLFSIEYKALDLCTPELNSQTVKSTFYCEVSVTNNTTGESFTIQVPVCDIPIHTELGYKVNGTLYTGVNVDTRRSGWYITPQRTNGKKELILELVPNSGRRITMKEKYGEIYISTVSQKKREGFMSLAVFLKALTGKTYLELAKLLGIKNTYILSTFDDQNELNRDRCIDEVVSHMFDNADYLTGDLKFKEIYNTLFSGKYINTENTHSRTAKNSSFLERCKGLTLAKPVLNYPKGTVLDADNLKVIDDSDVDTLYCYHYNKIYELKKYQTSDVLSIDEILMMANMFAVAIDGFPSVESRYELYNRESNSFNEYIMKEIKNYLTRINYQVTQKFISLGATCELSQIQIPPSDMNVLINKIKSSDKETQTSETTNALSVISKEFKVVTDYNGRSNEEMIKVKGSESSIYDHYQQPESKKVGQVNYLTLTAKKDEDGVLKGCFVKVENGKAMEDDLVYLTPYEIPRSYIAPWDVDLDKDTVECYYDGRIINVPIDKVQYQEYSPLNNLSLPTAEISYMNFSNGKRLVMGGNQSKQAALTIKRSRPLVSTGISGLYGFGLVTARDILRDFYERSGYSLISKDEFIERKIKLIGSTIPSVGSREYYFRVENATTGGLNPMPLSIKYSTYFCKRSTDDTMTSTVLNPNDTGEYQGDDIVIYDDSFDIKKYDLDIHADLGHQKIPSPKVFDTSLALGNNYLVSWKSFDLTCIDDAITISDSIIGTGMLCNVAIHEIKAELKDFDDCTEVFGLKDRLPDFTNKGLPKIGTFLKPNSLVIGKYKENKITGQRIDSSIRLDAITSGEVIATSSGDKYAVVYIASKEEIGLGDKMAGRHGNKGVVANIVPESQMPFTEDGEVIQICLNPQGIPSRMNISQLIEGAQAYALRKKARETGKDVGIVVTPQHKDSLKIAQDYIETYNVHPEYLRDGRTGKKFDRPSTVGVLYMMKLKHTSATKSNSTGYNKSVNPTTLQTRKGKKVAGGQTLGEMELWALASNNVPHVLQEFMSLQSDDLDSQKKLKYFAKTGDDSVLTCNNPNDTIITTLCRSLGVDVINSNDGGKYKLIPMTDEKICQLSASPIDNNRESLHNPSVFGSINNHDKLLEVRGNWSYFNLNTKIINPIWIYKGVIPKMIPISVKTEDPEKGTKFTDKFASKKVLLDIINGECYCQPSSLRTIVSKKDNFNEGSIPEGWHCGMSAVVKIFELTDLKVVLELYKARVEKSSIDSGDFKESNIDDIYKDNQIIQSIEAFLKDGINLKDFVIEHFPVMPANFRISMDGRSSDFDMHYTKIMSVADSCKSVDRSTELFNSVLAFTGLDKNVKHPKGAVNILQYFTGKGMDNSDGFIRDHTMSKILHFSLRGPIIPAKIGLLTLEQVGIPYRKAVDCTMMFIMPKVYKLLKERSLNVELNDTQRDLLKDSIVLKDSYKLSKLYNMSKEDSEKLLDDLVQIVEDVNRDMVVILGRQPTLHGFGIRAYKPVLVDGNALQLHHLVCAAYNADFDGDQMYGAYLISPKSRQEALENMSPTRDYINSKDGSFVLEPAQDPILGSYLATMLHENKTSVEGDDRYNLENVVFYNDLEMIKYDVENGVTKYQDLICYTKDTEHCYLSTAGRVLFNSIIPDGFTDEPFKNNLNLEGDFSNEVCPQFKQLRFDGLIKKKKDKGSSYVTYSMSDVTGYINQNYSGVELGKYMSNILYFGANYCDKSGISLGLDDLIQHPKIAEYVKKAESIVDKISYSEQIGLVSAKSRKELSLKIYRFICDRIKNTLFDYYPRNNNLFIMIDSGARGNLSQLMQTCGLIGVVSKTNSEALETPVLSNYASGLSSADQTHIAYGTRIGISSVQNDTALAGALTRGAAYTLSGLRIVEDDCGNDDFEFKVLYSDEIKSITLDGKECFEDDLLDLEISPSDVNFEKFIAISGGDKSISNNILYFVRKNTIRSIKTVKGDVSIKYKLDEMFKNLALRRVAFNLPDLGIGGTVTEKTLDYIESENLVTIQLRTMLGCKSVGGVCAHCYGLSSKSRKFPRVGTNIGIESAHAMGEPATQLNMNKINGGGLAGGNLAAGVNDFSTYVNGGVPKTDESAGRPAAIFATKAGYCKVVDSGIKYSEIELQGYKYRVLKKFCKVKDMEFVKPGDMLSDGIINVNDIKIADVITGSRTLEELRARQIQLLRIFYNLFISNSIEIDVRNFEAMVRAQLSLCRVFESDNPDFIPGETYFFQEVYGKPGVHFTTNVEHSIDVINKYSGFMTNLSFRDFAEVLARCTEIPDLQKVDCKSFLGDILVGQNIETGEKKKIKTRKFDTLDRTQQSDSNESKDFSILDKFLNSEDNKKEISKKLNSLSSLINFVSTNKSENTSNSIYNVTDDDDDEEYDDIPIIEDKSDIPPKSEESAYRKLSNFGRRD